MISVVACGETDNDKDEKNCDNGHTFKDGVCTVCGEKEEADEKNCDNGHTFVDGVCTVCGTKENTGDPNSKSEGTMTYEEYIAAELDSEVVIEAFVQAKQGWWDDKATIYLQDGTGGYLAYNAACSEELYDKLTIGTKVKVTGTKAEWKGLVELAEGAAIEIIDGDTYIAPVTDVTALLGTEELIGKQNMKIAVKGLTVAAKTIKGSDTEYAFLYNWDGSGTEGSDSDLYFDLTDGENTYTFVIEYYLTNENTDAYKAVQALKVGDIVDIEGFLYWYEGPQAHVTSVKVVE